MFFNNINKSTVLIIIIIFIWDEGWQNKEQILDLNKC